MELHVFDNKEILSDKLASWICNLIEETLKKQEFFTLVLSGGETPKLLYSKLASEKYKNKINWKRLHIFFGDERVVPFTDDRNNAKMAFDILLNHVDIPGDQIHIMRTDIQPNFAVDEYRKLLHKFFDSSTHSFDLVLLGMGDDGHTLSLFPDSPIINEHVHWVNAVYNEKQHMYRITLMPLIVNKSSQIVFMASGEKKASVLKEVLEGERNTEKLPAQSIVPVEGELHWFLDKAISADLART
ncbi:MAG: 6-phosphogluconolactonase [Ginsengibacter sp.]